MTSGYLIGLPAAGLRAFQSRGEVSLPPDLRMSVDAFRTQVIEDRGGVAALSAVEAAYITRLCELEVCARLLSNDLAQRGMFTARGRVRSVYGQLLQTIDRWDRLAEKVGRERRARQVDPFDAVRAAVEEANRS